MSPQLLLYQLTPYPNSPHKEDYEKIVKILRSIRENNNLSELIDKE